jgi:hypothetical protein
MSILSSIGSAFGKVGSVFGYVIGAVELVEKIAGFFKKKDVPLSGPDKQAMAIQLIREAIESVEGFSGKDIMDEVLFQQGLEETIPGVVKMLNASVWYKKVV